MASSFDKLSSIGRKTDEGDEFTPLRADRLVSGISGFESLSQGGFKINSVNLLSGAPGTGKSIFAMQFLMAGIYQGDTGIYISFEEPKESFFANMLSFGWDLKRYEKEGKLLYVEYTPEQVEKIISEGGGLLATSVERANATRLVVDSISSFLLLDTNELSKRESALALFKMIRKWKLTTILTDEHATFSGNDDQRSTSAIEFETDSILLLSNNQPDLRSERQRYIEILKMRGTNHIRRPSPYLITPKGIEIYPKGYFDDKGTLIRG